MPEFKEYEPERKDRDNDGKKDGSKKKLKIKNKWFFIGIIAVVVTVIFQKLRGSNEETTTESGYFEVPLGYSGYPDSIGGAIATDTTYVDESLSNMADEINTALDSIYTETDSQIKDIVNQWEYSNKSYDATIDELSQQLDAFGKQYDDVLSSNEELTDILNYQSIINTMKENSDKALVTDIQSEKDYLHNLNTQLGESIGAKFNSNDGYWYKDGQRLYSTALQSSRAGSVSSSSGVSSSPSSSPVSTPSYNDVIAQMEQNSIAYRTATTQEQKDSLYKQNQELGQSIGLSFDSDSGKWKTSSGADAWTYDGVQGSSNTVKVASSSSGSTSKKTTSSSSSSSKKTTSSSSTTSKKTNSSQPSWLTNAQNTASNKGILK